MIKSLIAFMKIFLTRKSFPNRDKLEKSDPMSSSYFSSHDKRKEAALRSLARKGEPKYGLMALLYSYQLISLLKENSKSEVKNKIDDLIKLLFNWKEKLDKE
tara:strand:- start:84 stop:389 length:306 start_codon:yes stop_codon:yes gene_type:complete